MEKGDLKLKVLPRSQKGDLKLKVLPRSQSLLRLHFVLIDDSWTKILEEQSVICKRYFKKYFSVSFNINNVNGGLCHLKYPLSFRYCRVYFIYNHQMRIKNDKKIFRSSSS